MELLIIGSVGTVSSLFALLGIWFRVRSMMIPLLLFLLFTILMDAVSSFYYFTSYTFDSDKIGNDFDFYRGIHTNNLLPSYTRNEMFFVIGKLIFSILLFRSISKCYRRNLLLRGGRSPFRSNKKLNNNNHEGLSISPELSKNSKYRKFSNIESI